MCMAAASSGNSGTLFEGGKTAHSTFKIHINILHNDSAVWNISKTSSEALLLKKCKLIKRGDCTMAHKYSIEA